MRNFSGFSELAGSIIYTNNLMQQNFMSRSKERLKFAVRACDSFFISCIILEMI